MPDQPTRIITATVSDSAAPNNGIAFSAFIRSTDWEIHASEAHNMQLMLRRQHIPIAELRANAHALDVLRVGLKTLLPVHALGTVAL